MDAMGRLEAQAAAIPVAEPQGESPDAAVN
jgi:hypothetical protein